jgi:importin subunit alpha-1
LQAVIEAGIIPPLLQILQIEEFEIKKEAAWAMSNATSGGTHDQIKYYFFPCNHLLFLLNTLAK